MGKSRMEQRVFRSAVLQRLRGYCQPVETDGPSRNGG